MSRLGAHVDPILALFALPWLVWPSPAMLLAGQAIVVATGAWPAYRLGARVTRDPRAGALLAGAFLLYPALGFLVLNEFHPVALAAPLLLWAFLYLEEERWVRAGVFLLLAALCKEDVPLVIALMGVYFAIRKRSPWPLVVTVAAAVYFALAFWVIIPHYSGGQSAFVARYSTYGDSASGVVKHAVTHPAQALTDVFSASNLRYWLALLWPFGFVSLLSPLTLLISAPELLLNALSSVGFQRRIEFHYTALEIPFLYAALVLGLMRLWRWLGGGFRNAEAAMTGQRLPREKLALFVLAVALTANFVLGPLPFSLPGSAYDGRAYARTSHDAVLDEATKLIPKDAVVSVNNNVGGQLSARPVVYVFPLLRQGGLRDRGRATPVLLRQGRQPAAPAGPGTSRSRHPLSVDLRQGRGLRVQARRAAPDRHATQLNTANLAVSTMSAARPTATTTLCARGLPSVKSARAM